MGLHYIHAAGVAHGDICPANVWLLLGWTMMNHDEPLFLWRGGHVRPWNGKISQARWEIRRYDSTWAPFLPDISGYFWILLLSIILEALRNRNDDVKLAGFQHLHPADPAPPDSCLVAAVGCVSNCISLNPETKRMQTYSNHFKPFRTYEPKMHVTCAWIENWHICRTYSSTRLESVHWAIIARGFTEGFLFWAFDELFFPFQCPLVLLEFVCNWQMNGSKWFKLVWSTFLFLCTWPLSLQLSEVILPAMSEGTQNWGISWVLQVLEVPHLI